MPWVLRSVAAAFALLLGMLSPPAEARILEESEVAGWTLAAIGEDDGRFAYCRISAIYNSDIELEISLGGKFDWGVALRNRNWHLDSGDKYGIRFSIDGSSTLRLEAEAISEHTVFFWLESADFVDRLRSGRQMRIEAAADVMRFDLDGTARAMAALESCADRRTRNAKLNPFAAPADLPPAATASAQPQPPQDSPADRRQARELMEAVLVAAGVEDFHLLADDEVPDGWDGYAALWQGAGLFGGLYIERTPADSDGKVVLRNIAAADAANCTGKFAADSSPDTQRRSDAKPILNIYTACSDEAGSDMTFYTVVPRAEDGFFVIFTASLLSEWRSAENAGDIDERIRQVLFELP